MKRPFEVTFLGGLFILVGLGSLVFHLWSGPIDRWTILIVAIGVAAAVGGIFLLLGHNWARWLLLVWLAAHVVISAFNSVSETLAHAVLLAVIGYFLLWSVAAKYFRSARPL
jgi:uncharacterized membrane protein HdeD (DUF308 family)